jgi:nucleotide-binding universal stress UspA family protein
MADYRTLLVPYDFSHHARVALDTALDLARHLDGVTIHLVHVIRTPAYAYAGYTSHAGATVPPPLDMEEVRASAIKSLDEVREVVAALHESLPAAIETRIVEGVAIDRALCETAESLGADLIVMGTHGRTGLAHVFLGSVAERTLRRAPCPVLTVHSDEEEEEGQGDGAGRAGSRTPSPRGQR